MATNEYIELHCRSAFSFLRGGSLPERLAETAVNLGLSALGLCDRMGVYGAPRFRGTASELGLRAINGAELAMEDGSALPVLVENRQGYQNLCRLLTRAHLRAPKGEGVVRWDELPEFAEGLVALTGGAEGPLVRALLFETSHARGQCTGSFPLTPSLSPGERERRSARSGESQRDGRTARAGPLGDGDELFPLNERHPLTPSLSPSGGEGARRAGEGERREARLLRSESALDVRTSVHRLLQAFGPNNIFVEIQRHLRRGEDRINRALVDLAHTHHLPLLATNGVLHATPEGRQVVDVFTCLRHHTNLDAAGMLLTVNGERHLKSPGQMKALFADLPEAVENTVRLADRLRFELTDLGYEFPKFAVEPGQTMEGVLREWAFRGARARYGGAIPVKIRKLLEKELALISKLGFAGYFLIVADIVRYCRENNIMAQGRGSAANSAVCFCLGITAVDPVKFNVLFERFLSENRKGWPDIDIDLPSGDRREQAIQEVYRRYGPHGAAMTGTVITYRGRSAAREIGKVLGLPADVLDRFANLFANGDFPHTLDLLAQMEKAGLPTSHPRAAVFASLYRQIGHLPRHLGQHSGGMIICQGDLNRFIPLENASMPGRVVAQWDKDDCEDLGIIKVDLLGLGMMAVLQDCVTLTSERGRPVDLAQLPENDPKTFELMRKADTIGVFQIESRAQMATLPRMKPEKFYDLVIEVAIIRPGPIVGDLAHPYLRRRNKEEPVTYYAPQLEPVLKRTLGVPLFQEQMLQMAMIMARFSGDEAEDLRRAMSFHRSEEKMQRAEARLRAAMDRAGVNDGVAERIVQAVGSFALYGFPESHAISFAHLAYASAYLKTHRAPEFFCALLNNQPMGFYSAATLVKDAKRHGVQVRPVCVMRSAWETFIESDDSLRLGLHQVEDLRRERALAMLEERARKPFATFDDFKARSRLSKHELRTLAAIGALNCFAPHRRAAMWQAERTVREGELFESSWPQAPSSKLQAPKNLQIGAPDEIEKPLESGACDLSGAWSLELGASSPLRPMDNWERLQADYAGLRLTTGPHPMALMRDRLRDVWRAAELKRVKNGETVRVGGLVICRQRPGTAKGVCFISLEDETGISNVIVASKLFERERLKITAEPFLQIEGIAQSRHGTVHIKAKRIERLAVEELRTAASHDFG